jgi:AcrR family transcriptional regulator
MKRAYRMGVRAESVDRTKERVVGAATELFSERPFDLVSLADVAERSGIGLATVVRHFETKEGLFAVAAAHAARMLDAQSEGTPENEPAAAVRSYVGSYERFGDVIVRLVAQEERVPAIHELMRRGRRVHTAWVTRVFAEALARSRGKARRRRFAQLMAATDVLFWKVLRRDLRLGRDETEKAMLEIVEGICK